jgi:pilus assembly protein Flp/PilA
MSAPMRSASPRLRKDPPCSTSNSSPPTSRPATRTERGASLVEYALLVALIAVVCIAAVTALGKKAKSNFNSIATSI